MPRLLLDEMLSDVIATQLRNRDHDVRAVVADPALAGLPDDAILAHAASERRALVTRNIKDFAALDAQYRAGGAVHAGIVLVSAKTFPEGNRTVGVLIQALDSLLQADLPPVGSVIFLDR